MDATIHVEVYLSASMIALVTLSTILVFGLATLPRPSAATRVWGVAFGLGMLATYLWAAGQEMDLAALRALASALMVCFEPIIWLGLRLHVGKRPIAWPVVLFVVGAPVLLGATADSPAYPVLFRSVFLLAGVFAGLVAWELLRYRRPALDVVLPLALVSSAFTVLAVAGFLAGLIGTFTGRGVTELSLLQGFNGVGTLITSVCAAVTIVLMVRVDSVAPQRGESAADRARRRLLKAQAQRDPAWSVLDIRIDDQEDLRTASTTAQYEGIADTFHERILDALPASSDAERVADGRTVVVIRAGDEMLQHHLRSLLDRISAIDESGPLSSLRISASIGCAAVVSAGYDYDVLAERAAEAADDARDRGGDRWVRR